MGNSIYLYHSNAIYKSIFRVRPAGTFQAGCPRAHDGDSHFRFCSRVSGEDGSGQRVLPAPQNGGRAFSQRWEVGGGRIGEII